MLPTMRVAVIAAILLVVAGAVGALLVHDGPAGPDGDEVPGREAPPRRDAPELTGRGEDAPPPPPLETPGPGTPPAYRVHGRITDPAGQGVGNVDVIAWLDPRAAWTRLGSAHTTADGRYRIDLHALTRTTRALRATSRIVVAARKDGFGGGAEDEIRPLPRDIAAGLDLVVDLELVPGSGVTGRVHGLDGRPLAGASVQLVGQDGKGAGYAATSVDGSFHLALEEGTPLDLVAHHQAHGWTSRRGIVADGSTRIDMGILHLAGAETIAGRVRYANGAPLAGVALYAHPTEETLQDADGAILEAVPAQGGATTDADGRFRLRVTRPGSYTVQLRRFDDAQPVLARTGDQDLDIVVSAFRIVVRVLDETGRVLPGCPAYVLGWRPDRRAEFERVVAKGDPSALRTSATASMASTGATGPDGTTQLIVEHGGAWVFMFDVEGVPAIERVFRVPNEGNEARLDITIPAAFPRGDLEIEVVDPHGAPIETFDFELRTRLGSSIARGRSLDPDSLLGLPAGLARLAVSAGPARHHLDRTCQILSPYFPVEEAIEILPGETTRVTVRPAAGGWIELYPELAGEAGEDALDALSIHVRPQGADDAWDYVGFFVYGEGETLHGTSELEPNEPTRIGRLFRPGDLELRFQGDGFKTQVVPVTVAPGMETPLRVRIERE